MDYIPTSLVKSCSTVFSELIAKLANMSFKEGRFPSCFKSAAVTPLLKKPGLDKSAPSNYRPISNLNYFSKILERLFLARIQSHILDSPNFNRYQSAYRQHHSTESSLLSTMDNIFNSSDQGSSTLLISLDLSAAFDTIDHPTLLNRLKHSFGLTDQAYCWIESYLTGRRQSVRIGQHSSPSALCTTGVPQGSVLGPLLFTIYTSPIAIIASSYNIFQQQYADDTQLFIALSPTNYACDITNIQACLAALHSWFCSNGMALNPDKSEAILFGTPQRSHTYSSVNSVDVAGATVTLADHVKILGVTLDNRLSMDDHVKTVCKAAFYHIRALRHIRAAITEDMAKTVACALVTARLDYANASLYGMSQHNFNRLQRIQSALARVVVNSPSRQRSTFSTAGSSAILRQLHWLPVKWRVRYKIATLTYKLQSSGLPTYLSDLLKRYEPSRVLRTSNTNLLTVPRFNLTFGSRSFRVAAPTVWNSLPPNIRSCTSLSSFCRALKTFLFHSASADF